MLVSDLYIVVGKMDVAEQKIEPVSLCEDFGKESYSPRISTFLLRIRLISAGVTPTETIDRFRIRQPIIGKASRYFSRRPVMPSVTLRTEYSFAQFFTDAGQTSASSRRRTPSPSSSKRPL